MRFAATCPECKRDVVALSMAMLEIKAKEHHAKCVARAHAANEKHASKALAEFVQPSLPLGGES